MPLHMKNATEIWWTVCGETLESGAGNTNQETGVEALGFCMIIKWALIFFHIVSFGIIRG